MGLPWGCRELRRVCPAGACAAPAGSAGGISRRGIERLLELAGVALLGLGEGFDPVGDFAEAFVARGLGHARIHVGVFVGFPGDRGLEVVRGGADRQAGGRIAGFLEIFEMAMGMAGLTLGGRAEYGGDIVVAFDVGLARNRDSGGWPGFRRRRRP